LFKQNPSWEDDNYPDTGVSIDDIKEMLGHDDETETCIYIHVTVDAAKQLLENHIGNPNR
jgi:site-specific recombinase XerD